MSRTDTSFSRQINSSTKITVVPISTYLNPNSPIYAINWFNVRLKWLYNFYNILAAPLVLKVGGKVHFKGFKRRKIIGDAKSGRDALLIVKYKGPDSFLDLVDRTYFQLISVFRITSTKHFNFGFTQRTDVCEEIGGDFTKKKYLIHHYVKTTDSDSSSAKVEPIMKELGIKTHYSGEKVAEVLVEDKNGKQQKAPFIIHGIVVLECSDDSKFDQLVVSEAYSAFLEQFSSNYIALFDRVR